MKSSLFFLISSLILGVINAASIKLNKANLDEDELNQFKEKSGADLMKWVNEKRLKYETASESSLSSLSDSPSISGSNTPGGSSSFSSRTSSSPSSTPSISFDQKILVSLIDVLRSKDYKLAVKLLSHLPNWKMTYNKSNFSALSLIAKLAKSKFLGKLVHPDALSIFEPFINGKMRSMSGGYFIALSLFHPQVQVRVMTELIRNAPHLRGVLLMNSIYYHLHESVLVLLIESGAILNFESSDDISPLRALPSYSQSSSNQKQVPITKRFFMNFSEDCPVCPNWESQTSADSERNFALGMIEVGIPEEVGALRLAFERYTPSIVAALIDMSPLSIMTNYHLAHLLAKNPEKSEGYLNFESLVDSELIFNRILKGESDLVSLAYISTLPASDQVQVITEFLANTKMFHPAALADPKTITISTSKRPENDLSIYELPLSSADVFLVTACKWNIADEAFEMLWAACKHIKTRQFFAAKKIILDIAESNNFTGKLEIMNRN